MTTLCPTRVPFLSRLRTACRPSAAFAVARHCIEQQRRQTRVQIGAGDKCTVDSSNSPLTYLCFSHNFTRLSAPLKKWPHSGQLCSDSVKQQHYRQSLCTSCSSSSQTSAYCLPDSLEPLAVEESSGSDQCPVNCWHAAGSSGEQWRNDQRITASRTTDRNHRSSLLDAASSATGHLALHLSASKLTGNFGYTTVASSSTAAITSTATNATECSHWTRIGAIKATTRTTRDTRNNKWTSVGQRTRPQQHQVQVLPLQTGLVAKGSRQAQAAPLYAWQANGTTAAATLRLECSVAASLAASSALQSSRLTGQRNAFNKLMTSTTMVMQRRMIATTSATAALIQRLGLLLPTTSSVATCTGCLAVSGEVICKRHRVMQRAPILLNSQSRSSLWTSSARFDSEDGKTKRCWRCDKPINAAASPATSSEAKVAVCEKCGSIQPISADVNFFGLFNLDTDYDIDLAQLRQQYLRLQQNMHPDMNVNRSNTETGYSMDNSSIINSAYKTLRDPYQRALYLLKLCYNISIDEGSVETEPELLLEIMELNEDIELADDKDSLMAVSARLNEDIAAMVAQLKTAFAEDNASEARRLVVRLTYYNSSMDKLRGQLASEQK